MLLNIKTKKCINSKKEDGQKLQVRIENNILEQDWIR